MTRRKNIKASDAKILKMNRTTGMRTLGRGETYTKHTVGNHIRTSAKVGNILNHVSYASTDSVPYFVSTLSRYTALKAARGQIVGAVADKTEPEFKEIAELLADKIKVNETKEIMEFSNSIRDGMGGNPTQVVDQLNKLTMAVNGRTATVQEYVQETIDSLRVMYFRFMSSDKFNDKLAENFARGIETDVLDDTFMPVSDVGKGIKYRNEEKTLENYEEAVADVLGILSSDEFFMNDLLSISQSLSFMYKAGLQSVGQTEGGGIASLGEFQSLQSDFRNVIKDIEAKVGKEGDSVGYKGGRNAFGQISEFVTAYALKRVLGQISDEGPKMVQQGKGIISEVQNDVSQFSVEMLSGRDENKWKTADYKMNYGSNSIHIDNKQVGSGRAKRVGGLVYDAGTTVDIADAFQDFVYRDSGSSSSARRLYRSMVLNISAAEGYDLKGQPQEREMLFKQALKDKKNFDNKFFSDDIAKGTESGHGYPPLVTINGKIHIFSEVIRKMGDKDNFTADFEGKKGMQVGSPVSINAGEMYGSKMRISDGERVKGFAAMVPENVALVNRIESQYFAGDRTRRVRFIINLK